MNLRDAPVPAHECRADGPDAGHCPRCGERVPLRRPLRGPIAEVKGLDRNRPEATGSYAPRPNRA